MKKHPSTTPLVRTGNKVSPLYRIGIANRLSLRSYVTGCLSTCGRFALHLNPDWFDGFTVTHIPTGHCVARVGTKREAFKVMSAFQRVKSPAWSWRHPLKVSKACRKEGRAICDRLRLPTGSGPTWNDATCREWVKTFVKPELIADILAEVDPLTPPANTEAVK